MWTLAFGQHEDPTPTHGYEPTREAAMAAFAKSLAEGVADDKPAAPSACPPPILVSARQDARLHTTH
jgi:hypothetical protein